MRRLALVVHPSRPIEGALETLHAWAERHGLAVVQLRAEGADRTVAEVEDVGPDDLVVALGGDGTVLTALRAAAPTETPVLGVACGSLGALSAVSADDIELALDRAAAGTWPPRRLPALEITSDAGAHEWAINDFVVSRRGSGQLLADVSLDGELYVRLAGDGVIVASTLGSSAYTMAAGGPILAPGTDAFVVTPLAMHGGSAPPLVVPAAGVVTVQTQPGFSGHATDTDGHERTIPGDRFEVRLRPDKALLVAPTDDDRRGLTGLRRRKLIIDSPRVLARDERERR